MLKDSLGWGFLLWLVGYALGIAFFAVLPARLIGWAVMPLGIALTLWVLPVAGSQMTSITCVIPK